MPIGIQKEALAIAHQLRRAGLNVEVACATKRIKKLFRYANQMGIPFVVTVGESELEEGVVNLKNMREETEVRVPVEQAAKTILEALPQSHFQFSK